MQQGALYYIPPGPDVRELGVHERPTLGMVPPYSQAQVRTFETSFTFHAKNGPGVASVSTSESSASSSGSSSDRKHRGRRHTRKRRHKRRDQHGDGGDDGSCGSSCNRSLSIASMGSKASLDSTCFSTIASYGEYKRDRHHLRKYIGSGDADTASLRRAIDSYWNRYGPKGCIDRRLPHSEHCKYGRPSRRSHSARRKASPCRCSARCVCRGGARRECDYSRRECEYSHRAGGHRGSWPPRHGAHSSEQSYQEYSGRARGAMHGGSYRREDYEEKRGGSYERRGHQSDDGRDGGSYYLDDPHAASKRTAHSERKALKRGPRRLLRASDTGSLNETTDVFQGEGSYRGPAESYHQRKASQSYHPRAAEGTCECKKCRAWRRTHGDDNYVVVIGKDITRLIHPHDRHSLACKSGLVGCASSPPSHKQRSWSRVPAPPISLSDDQPKDEQRRQDARPPPVSLPQDLHQPEPESPPPATRQVTEGDPALPALPTAAAAAGYVRHTQSPTNANNYYHYYSDLPAAKMNSFHPDQVTEIQPRTGAVPRVQQGLRPGVESVGVSTIGVELD